VDSREEFSLWCCRLHNEVNEKLGYESKYDPCEITSLDQRWLVGRKACWDADD
jgi:Erv1 / Alr family